MNLKKILLNITAIMLFVIFVLAQSGVYATTLPSGQEVYMGITELMTNDTPNMGYALAEPGSDGVGPVKIWNIIKYKSSTSSEYEDGNIYCVKAGVGFTETDDGVRKRQPYDVFYDMKTERETIKTQNDILKGLVEGTITENGTTINCYDAILTVLDRMYLPGESTEAEKKELIYTIIDSARKSDTSVALQILNAFDKPDDITESDFLLDLTEQNCTDYELTEFALTDSDINAIQQAVLWYFTNYGQLDDNGNTKYNKIAATGWLNYTLDGNEYNNLTEYDPDSVGEEKSQGAIRNYQAEILYNYMINQAKENANNYTNSSTTLGVPAVVNTTKLSYTESGDNYIVGPINITESDSNHAPYTIDLVVKNNETTISDYTLLDKNQNSVTSGTTIKSLVGEDFYLSIPKSQADSLTVSITVKYNDTTMTLWASSKNNEEQPLVEVHKESKSDTVTLTLESEKIFDLALRKYITKVNGVELTGTTSRVPKIDEATLTSGTTATYKHKKDPVTIATGDKVTYKMTIYNEGEKAGRATKVVDQLPTGLEFANIVSGNFELGSYDTTTNTLTLVRKANNSENLSAYTSGNLDSETIEIECKVTATPDKATNKILTNVAWISEEYNAEDDVTITNQKDADRDSEPLTTPSVNKDNMSDYKGNGNKSDLSDSNYYYKGQQDDDDFEKLVLLPESFDLKLIKRITAVNNQNVPERIESVDVSKLNTLDDDGNLITTGDYQLSKEPVGVKKGDIVTYTFRIYNEGTISGYAEEITEDVPEGLEFLWSEKEGEELQADTTLTEEEKEAIEFNQKYLWGKFVYDEAKENIIQISTDFLAKKNEVFEDRLPADYTPEKYPYFTSSTNLILGYNADTMKNGPHFREISVKFKVVSENTTGTVIRNEAAITEDCDENGNSVDDRDSDTEKWVKYEDDEDYDNIILQSFDLALRKFIIAVSDDTKIEDDEYLKNQDGSYTRAPVVDTSKLNTLDKNGKLITTATYNHTKEPVLVQPNDIVVYMLRVYNEGDMDGYASEIKDHLPPYLEFVDDEFNKQYGWEVSEDGRTVTTRYLENSKIKAAEKLPEMVGAYGDEDGNIIGSGGSAGYILSYKEVPIMCKVKEDAKTSENITNIADITEYLDENKDSVTDRDSQEDNVNLPDDENLPGYKEEEKGSYVPGQQDDDDFEKVIIKKFDLALRKWVTQAIVIEDGQQTVTPTGHDAWDDPEAVVKVELHRKKINQVTVKFRYSIRVYNQGEIAGYAKEITDYVPEGLKFIAEDNPGWTDEGNNVISTRLLENTLLQPGEYADVEVLLTWINNENNMGVMTNTAEISEDYNEYGVPDIDSTPDNQKPGEDDIDDAPVMLSVSTGQMRIYFTLGFIVLITVAGGVILIKKFVL